MRKRGRLVRLNCATAASRFQDGGLQIPQDLVRAALAPAILSRMRPLKQENEPLL
jgi:hypothetical protein